MDILLLVLAGLAEVGAAAIFLFGVDWGDYRAKRREAAASASLAERKTQLEQALEVDYQERQVRIDMGKVPNVPADMEPRRRIQAQLKQVEAQLKQPITRDASKDQTYFVRKCIATSLVVLGIILGFLASSMDDEKDAATQTSRAVNIV